MNPLILTMGRIMGTVMNNGWIGVDLDGTLARNDHSGYPNEIGPPVEKMVSRVRMWLANGHDVRIVTARAAGHEYQGQTTSEALSMIEKWLIRHVGQSLPVQAHKDYNMIELWDDRSVSVEPNTGRYVRFTQNGNIKSH